jgi:hypothetical protein
LIEESKMGLVVSVGFSERDIKDEAFIEKVPADLKAINVALKAAGVKSHKEKLPLPREKTWQAEIGSYSSLHYLRRFAAVLAVTSEIPAPLAKNKSPTETGEILRYWDLAGVEEMESFDHLMFHSDADGYYVPIEFPTVLKMPGTDDGLGSSIRLKQECENLAAHLEFPLPCDIDFDDDVLWKKMTKAAKDKVWSKYPTEAFVCAVLHTACERSIQNKALIWFG